MNAGQWPPRPMCPPGGFPGNRGPMFGGRGFPPGPRPRGPGPMGFRPQGPPRSQGGWPGFPRGRMPAPGNACAFNRNPDMSHLETWGVGMPPQRPPFKRPHPGFHDNQGHGNQGQYYNKQAQKKPKMDKRELPENNKYFCEVCDRGFKMEDKFKEHVAGHEKCTYEGCNYEAAAKLVRNHIQFQHKTGLARKIWSLESKEDIAKWIAERKKNFPTKDTIAKKEETRREQVARGEVLETKQFGKMRNQRGGRGRGRGRGQWQDRGHDNSEGDKGQGGWHDDQGEEGETHRGRGRYRNRRRGRERGRGRGQGHDPSDPAKPPGSPELPSLSSLRRNSTPTSDPLAYFGKDDDSDSEEGIIKPNPVAMGTSPATTTPTPKAPLQLAGALGSLAASYTDSESDSETRAVNSSTVNATESRSVSSTRTDNSSSTLSSSVSSTKTDIVSSTKPDIPASHNATHIAEQKVDGLKETEVKEEQPKEKIDASKENKTQPESVSSKEKAWDDEDKPLQKPQHPKPQWQAQGNRNRQKQRPPVSKKRLSLLEKLLAPDVRHERNVILQCVRYIVQHNFLGVNDKPTTDTTSSMVVDSEPANLEEESSKQTVSDEEIWENGL